MQSIPRAARARMRAAHEADKAPEKARKRLAQVIGASVIASLISAALAVSPGPKPQPVNRANALQSEQSHALRNQRIEGGKTPVRDGRKKHPGYRPIASRLSPHQ